MNTDALQWAEPGPLLARAVADEFRLLSEIGRGGMGVVYLAEDTRLLRRVAIKTLLPHLASDALVRERFVRESRTAAALSHPGIVPIYAAAEQAGVVYFVMGYVQGESLADRLARTGPLAAREALLLVRQVAEALGFAHAAGVVHRDVKAENVIVDATGRAMITDFGIARVGEAQPLTATGTVLGSVYYMSPEQVTGEPLDGRSDVYALGVLLHHLLTGRYPYERAQASAVLVAHVTMPVPSLAEYLPDADPRLDALIRRMLAKAPRDRVASALELLHQVDELLQTADSPPAVPRALTPGVQAVQAVVSSTEAQQIWGRAAELQAHTGVIVPPPAFALHAPDDRIETTRGYDAAVVKAAALEAGIDAKYVDRAFSERAEAQALAAQAPIDIQLGERLQQAPSRWKGAHDKLEFETTIDGEIPLDLFEELADEARRALGELPTVSVVGRTLTIATGSTRYRQNNFPRTVQIQVAVRNGRTTIRAFEDLSQVFGGLLGGVGFGAGMGLSPLAFGLTLRALHDPVLAGLGTLATFLTAQGLGRYFFVRTSRKREKALRALVERLARLAQAGVASRTLKP